MRTAFQMDHPSRLNAKTDTTLMLIEEAITRGHEAYFYHPTDLSYIDGELTAPLARIYINAAEGWKLEATEPTGLSAMQSIWIRQDPPFDMHYLTATYLLEHLPPTTKIFNHPAGVRNAPEKLSPLQFRQFMPPTLISLDLQEILAFARANGTIVAKPLYGFGGRSVFKLSADDPNIETLVEQARERRDEPLMWQRFLPAVAESDKRIILIDGEVAAVFQRKPAAHSIRANMRVGGKPIASELTAREKEICAAIGPFLKSAGLLLVGLDVIGDHLTEINVTSPTGLRAAQALYGVNLAAKVWEAAEKQCK